MTEEPVGGQAAEEAAAAERTGQAAADAAMDGTARGTRRRGHRRAVSPGPGGPAGLLPILAKEDDPRAWGDGADDSESWLREQRPPHWG